MAKRCPSCHHPVEEDAFACPNCPASWESAEEAEYRRVHAPKFGLRRFTGTLQLSILSAITLFGAWEALRLVLRLEGPEKVDPTLAAVSPIPQSGSEPDAAVLLRQARSVAASPNAAPTPVPSAPPPETEQAESQDDGDSIVMISHEEKASAPVRRWRFRGRVLDLKTLSPIKRCALDFTDPDTAGRFRTATDGEGRFRVELPPLEGRGYSVKISAEGYAASYLDPATQGVPDISAEQRASLAKNLAHSLAGFYALQAASEKPETTDFYLAPAD